jgi:hypothetical protein
MGRTFSLVGVVMFTVGVIALSSLARRTMPQQAEGLPERAPRVPDILGRRVIPVFAFDSPFSLN